MVFLARSRASQKSLLVVPLYACYAEAQEKLNYYAKVVLLLDNLMLLVYHEMILAIMLKSLAKREETVCPIEQDWTNRPLWKPLQSW
jgi:hypothetical protein